MKKPYSKNAIILGGMSAMLVVALLIALVRNDTTPTTPTISGVPRALHVETKADWRSIPFENVRTQQQMTFADFTGKTVVVEAVSIWCANCQVQQKASAEALAKLGSAAPVYISLDLDIAHPDDDAQSVANHEDYKQFSWIFAITNKPLTRALINAFGYNVLNAPITPIFVISPDGKASDLYTGLRSVDDMLGIMQAGLKTQ
jgi:thiol-disulfide isomerase/thioredoxin